jgi:hypothetical protein
MILPNRPFERVAPSREARSIYIFCEGVRREFDYFNYFVELDSRINVEVYKLHPHDDNSPLGLLRIAEKCILGDNENSIPKYNFDDKDQVWIVLDIDSDKYKSREPQIERVRSECEKRKNWYLSRSNPCFEVWLYYHIYAEKPNELSNKGEHWKQLVDSMIPGGFDSRKHPLLIEHASKNAEKNFQLIDNMPDLGCTEVYNLANSILPLVKDKLRREIKNFEIDFS